MILVGKANRSHVQTDRKQLSLLDPHIVSQIYRLKQLKITAPKTSCDARLESQTGLKYTLNTIEPRHVQNI